jgi:hypothetical protein
MLPQQCHQSGLQTPEASRSGWRGIGGPIDKPHGMRWATFDREMEQIEAAEAICNTRLLRFIQKLTQHG